MVRTHIHTHTHAELSGGAGQTWQKVQGAVAGVNVILRAFEWKISMHASAGPQLLLSLRPTLTFSQLPHFISDGLPNVLYTLLSHPQVNLTTDAILLSSIALELFVQYLDRLNLLF